jgi:hypothetical protein
VCDYYLAKMAAALEMPVGLSRLPERKCPVDHGVEAVHGDSSVHRLEISTASDADRPERYPAAGQ